jgi:peptidoglycan hydrolase-like protein with peptidoglycan-binding domain
MNGLDYLGADEAADRDVNSSEFDVNTDVNDDPDDVREMIIPGETPRDRWRKWGQFTRQFSREGVHMGGEVTIPTADANYTDAKTVAAVQQALVNKGYDLGSSGPASNGVDGVFGPKTKAAIKKMQTDANLTQSGIIDEGVIMALKVTPGVLPPGVTMEGRAAVQAQVALDAATAAEHAVTPSDAVQLAQKVAEVAAAAAPPPPPAVQEKVQAALVIAKAAKTSAQAIVAAAAIQVAAKDVHAAVKPSFFETPAWSGGPPRWQVGVGAGLGVSVVATGLALLFGGRR